MKEVEMNMILFLFLENVTHIVQILDISVFNIFKATLNKEIYKKIIDTESPPPKLKEKPFKFPPWKRKGG